MVNHSELDPVFELEFLGGPVERRFRAKRPQTEKLPWGTLNLADYDEQQLVAGRRGWTDMALQEYSAASVQLLVIQRIIRVCAPLDLSALAAGFPFEELVHTELCARMAAELGGTTGVTYSRDQLLATHLQATEQTGGTLLDTALLVGREFCIAETVTLGQLRFRLHSTTEPLVRAVWRQLVKDEAGHARFGWLFMDWAMPQLAISERDSVFRSLRSWLHATAQTDALVAQQRLAAFSPVGIFGGSGRQAYLTNGRRVRAQVAKKIDGLSSYFAATP